MAKILVIAPLMDIPTATSFNTATHLVEWARAQGHTVLTLAGSTALRPLLIYQMLAQNPDIVSYFGHGTENALIGSFIFYAMANPSVAPMFKETIVHTMACLSALELGQAIVQAGSPAYFGADYYLLAAFPEPDHNYLADWQDYMTVIPKSLLGGEPTGVAFERYKRRCSEYIQRYTQKLSEWANADWYIQATKQNRDRYHLIGSQTISLQQSFAVKENRNILNLMINLMH